MDLYFEKIGWKAETGADSGRSFFVESFILLLIFLERYV